jgi:hypothetical protein
MVLHHQLIQWLEAMDWNTFLGAAFGSVLSFGFAWWLLHYQIKLERRLDNEREAILQIERNKERDTERLKFYQLVVTLFERAVKGWENAISDNKSFIVALHEDPFGMPSHPVQINTPQRTLDRMDRVALHTTITGIAGVEAGDPMHRELIRAVDFFTEVRDLHLSALEAQKQDIDRSQGELFQLVVGITNELRAWLSQRPGTLDPLAQQVGSVWTSLVRRPGGVQEMPMDAVLNEIIRPLLVVGDGLGRGQADLMPLMRMCAEFGSLRNRVIQRVRNLARYVGEVNEVMQSETSNAKDLLTKLKGHIPQKP